MKIFQILLCAILLSGCGEARNPEFRNITESNLVIIAYDDKGELVDFRRIQDSSHISQIKVYPKNGENNITVTVIGKSKHPVLKDNMYVSTRIAEGYFGHLEINFVKGIVVNVLGNSVGTTSKVNDAMLKAISEHWNEGRMIPKVEGIFEIIETSKAK